MSWDQENMTRSKNMIPFSKLAYLKVFFFLALCFTGLSLHGQTALVSGENREPADLKEIAAKAQRYLSAAQPDSAMLILRAPLRYLKQNKQLNTPLGLEIQYIQAQSLEVDQQDSLALESLLHLKEISRNLKNWTIYAKTCLVLANLHEKLGRSQQSKANLEDARIIVKHHELDTIHGSFAIRMSSWQRIFGQRDSARHYAQMALVSAQKIGNLSQEAQAHLLLGGLSAGEDYLKTIGHYEAAARLCGLIDDYLGQTNYNNGIASLYLRHHQPEKALTYNTKALTGVQNAVRVGYEKNWIGHRAYQLRGEIFEALGQMDSAFYYLQQGAQMEIENLRDSQRKEVAEIDAKYNDEKKNFQLAQQQLEIRQAHKIRYLLTGAIFLIILVALVLIYSYLSQRRINQKVKKQAEQLQELDQMKSRFFANVSHELRTPLTLMMGPVRSLLKNDYSAAQQKKFLRMASDSGKQLEQLINEILDLQKLSVGKLQLQTENTPLLRFFRSKIAQFESLATYKTINFSYKLELSDRQSAMIDREKCRQILFNLLSNAFKFTPYGGKVEVNVGLSNHQLTIKVSDTGRGIPHEDLPHLFDRYFQYSKPNGPAEGGTGIGLAICKEYIHLMGGEIAVESQLNVGTTFTATLPLQEMEIASNHEKDTSIAPSVVEDRAVRDVSMPQAAQLDGKPPLLLVEDNPGVQAYLHALLSDKYQISTARNGEEALQLLANSTGFQLILSDLMMPIMDGFQLLERVKSSDATRHIPFIMLTARAAAYDKLKALRIGVDDYLLKPFDEEELTTRIENLLQHQANRRQVHSEETSESSHQSAADQAWLIAFEAYVQANLSSDILSVPMLADEFAMSKSTLLRQLKRLTGLSPKQYVLEARLYEARRLLENGMYRSVSEVSNAIGYGDVRSFSRLFKKRYGKLPSEL